LDDFSLDSERFGDHNWYDYAGDSLSVYVNPNLFAFNFLNKLVPKGDIRDLWITEASRINKSDIIRVFLNLNFQRDRFGALFRFKWRLEVIILPIEMIC
jgi:hypothetical protein